MLHGDDVVGIGGGLIDVVQHHHSGALVLVGEPLQKLHQAFGVKHIQIVERLVEQHIIGLLAKHHRNHGPLALSAGELGEIAFSQRLKPEFMQRGGHDFAVEGLRAALVVGKAAEHQ